jgi:hypothetical protein
LKKLCKFRAKGAVYVVFHILATGSCGDIRKGAPYYDIVGQAGFGSIEFSAQIFLVCHWEPIANIRPVEKVIPRTCNNVIVVQIELFIDASGLKNFPLNKRQAPHRWVFAIRPNLNRRVKFGAGFP